jgi:hypothetical protein
MELHLWECEKGHRWEARPSDIKNKKTWCPVCAGKRKHTLDDAVRLAESRGGKCLSQEYINSNVKMMWECEKGHIWFAPFKRVKNNGTWCLICSGSAKHTIEYMREIAERKEGKCLSEEYVNQDTKLLWQCKYGHEWMAAPLNIVNHSNWCKVCGWRSAAIKRSEKRKKASTH